MANKKQFPKIVYSEPEGYIPRELRQKYKLGEYAESNAADKGEESSSGESDGRS